VKKQNEPENLSVYAVTLNPKNSFRGRFFKWNVSELGKSIMIQKIYTPASVATKLDVSVSTVLRWIHKGRISTESLDGKRNCMTGQSILKFISDEKRRYDQKKGKTLDNATYAKTESRMNELRIISDARELDGTCFMEILPGEFKQKHWNNGSIFFAEETFVYLEPILRKHVPKYDHYENSEVKREICLTIIEDLYLLQKRLAGAASFKEIKVICCVYDGYTDLTFDTSFDEKKEALIEVIVEFAVWLRRTITEHEQVTIIGI